MVNLLTKQYQESQTLNLLLTLPNFKKNIIEWSNLTFDKIMLKNKIVKLDIFFYLLFVDRPLRNGK